MIVFTISTLLVLLIFTWVLALYGRRIKRLESALTKTNEHVHKLEQELRAQETTHDSRMEHLRRLLDLQQVVLRRTNFSAADSEMRLKTLRERFEFLDGRVQLVADTSLETTAALSRLAPHYAHRATQHAAVLYAQVCLEEPDSLGFRRRIADFQHRCQVTQWP